MADSILRLKVESQEYDNKLKQATQGLTRYADECRKVGGTLEVVEKDTLDYVRALGQMDTTSRTATGKLAEMKKTFVELSAQYKQMTDAEKNSPFGKALAASLDQLKGRIQDSKSQLDDINKSVNGGGGLTGALDSLSDKFGMSVQSLAGWGTALAAGKAALDVAKDAFFASEETVDEWGRVMDSSKSLYEGFLTALNTGDISGYLNRIDSIVQAARAAYNELDRLGTMKTIQAPQMSAQQTENERMRMMIQTGRYIAPVDGRRASMKNGQLLTPDQIKRIEQQLQGGMQKVVTLVGNEVAQTGRAIDAVYNRQAQELGMSLKEFRKGTSSMAEFDKRMTGYDQYQKWRAEHTTIDQQSGREIVARGNPFEQFAKWGTFRVDGNRYNDLVKLVQQRDQQAGSLYGMQSQAYRTMNRAEGVTVSKLMKGGVTGGGGRSAGGSGGGKSESTFAPDQIKRIEQQLQGGMQKVVTLVGNEVAQTGRAIDAVYNRQAQELGMSLKEFRKGTSSMAEFDKRMTGYDQYQKWRAEHTTIDQQSGREIVARGNPFEQFAKWGTFRVDGNRYNDLVKLVQQRDQQAGSLYGMQSQAYRTMNRAEGVTVSKLMKGGVTGGGGRSAGGSGGGKSESTFAPDSIAAQQKLVADLTRQWNEAGAEVRNQYVGPLVEAEAKLKDMKDQQALMKEQAQGKLLGNTSDGKGIEVPISSSASFEEWMNSVKEQLANLKIDPIEIPIETTTKDVKAIAKAASITADVVGSIGDAFNAIEDPAAKVMGTVMQAIASVALGYAQATVQATSMGPWAWVAFAATGLATMLTMISTIHSATGYATGGMIEGNTYSGDQIPAMLNAGEVVLNRAQQGNLASQLEGGGMRNMNLSGRIRGTDIILSVDRTLSLEGKQLLTWGR